MNMIILICLTLVASIWSQTCDIVVLGGTLASLGAIIHSPNQFSVCLVEPTDRLGGQLGQEGVWHIDFNWLYQNGYPDKTIAYNPLNIHPLITQITKICNTGDCWVSRNCFLYDCFEPLIMKYLSNKTNLKIYFNSVVKSVKKLGSRIIEVEIIERSFKSRQNDCRSVDQIIKDWYSSKNSQVFQKKIINLKVNKFIIQGSQYGDGLVLSRAQFMQGTSYSSACGQSIVFGFLQTLNENGHQQFKLTKEEDFSLDGFTVEQIWRYRRLKGSGLGINQGQISLQNWNGPGNDYNEGYLFAKKEDLNKDDWDGGLNYLTLKNAEQRSLNFHQWFKNLSKLPLKIDKENFKTCSGTSQLPYIRDGRRSIGYRNFILKQNDVSGIYEEGGNLTAPIFVDRISIGMYNMDLHQIKGCKYDDFASKIPLPFFIPLRALSNIDISNMLVIGRAIAQDFYVSSATRTPTTEIGIGASSMIIATFMLSSNINSVWNLIDCPECIMQLQSQIRKQLPIQWTINGKKYPSVDQKIEEQ